MSLGSSWDTVGLRHWLWPLALLKWASSLSCWPAEPGDWTLLYERWERAVGGEVGRDRVGGGWEGDEHWRDRRSSSLITRPVPPFLPPPPLTPSFPHPYSLFSPFPPPLTSFLSLHPHQVYLVILSVAALSLLLSPLLWRLFLMGVALRQSTLQLSMLRLPRPIIASLSRLLRRHDTTSQWQAFSVSATDVYSFFFFLGGSGTSQQRVNIIYV